MEWKQIRRCSQSIWCLQWNPACVYVNVPFLRYRIIQIRLFKTLLLLSKLLYKSGRKVIELKVWASWRYLARQYLTIQACIVNQYMRGCYK